MEIEQKSHEDILHASNSNTVMESLRTPKMKRLIMLSLNILLLLIGGTGSPLILRVYFLHGGDRKWFSGFLQTAGFPFLLFPMLFSFLRRRRTSSGGLFLLTPPLFLYCAILGLITGIDDYLYSYGLSFLPVSTASLLISMQLGFTAIFAFFIVKQKFNSFTVNAVVLLTFGAVVLGVHANGDRPDGESKAKYYLGFVLTLAAAVIYAIVLPLVELLYKHAKQEVTYALVIEMQFVIGLFATVVCAIGMVVNKDFQAISREGKHYGLGEVEYYLVVFFTTIIAQFCLVGLVGTIKYSSALLSGVILAVCIPITEVLAVFFFHEKFDGEKGVALALSLWGTSSYFYGEYKEHKKSKVIAKESQLLPLSFVSNSTE
ncbi:purine permease 3-like [Dendrobium catenatum]|uniref:purine permease 3-like n=1 Tax=Dendrobium catenatum TaxID=906689 RepID=UPI0009F1F8C4|nr:purine permease 3-like [Dendrobium catenatum]